MKTALALVAIAVAGVASSPAYGLADAGVPAGAGNLRRLDEAPPANPGGGMEDAPDNYEDFAGDKWLESGPDDEESWRGGCRPGSWRWPGCRWGGGGGGGCWPGSWRWPGCKYHRGGW